MCEPLGSDGSGPVVKHSDPDVKLSHIVNARKTRSTKAAALGGHYLIRTSRKHKPAAEEVVAPN